MPVVMKERGTVKVSSTGTLAIPKGILELISATPGEKFKVERDGFGLRLVPMLDLPAKTVDEVGGCLRDSRWKKRTDAQVDRDIAALIKAQDDATKGC
jgi:bifunctional DNA-binding transcriptional regulator/antitoxin component of YhaV-PrlF toxin-antitoxin module